MGGAAGLQSCFGRPDQRQFKEPSKEITHSQEFVESDTPHCEGLQPVPVFFPLFFFFQIDSISFLCLGRGKLVEQSIEVGDD